CPGQVAADGPVSLCSLFQRRLTMVRTQQPEISRARLDGGIVTLVWSDAVEQRLHPLWLREQAPDAESRDARTGQRLLDAWSLPLDLKVERVEPQGREGLDLLFSDGHRTRYPLRELRAALLEDGAPASLVPPGQRPWRVTDEPRSEA